MIRTIMTLMTALTLLSTTACTVAGAPDEETEATDELSAANKGMKAPPGRPHGPPPCDSDAECADKCPADALGCACVETLKGDSVCAPTCEEDADCPAPPEDRPPLSCHEGICRPPPPPPCSSGGGGPPAAPSPQRVEGSPG